MKRKIVKHGPSSLTISLPAKWAKEHGLKAGDEIDIEEKANMLLISRYLVPEEKEFKIEVSSKENYLNRFLVIPYVKGYDTIRVKYSDTSIFPLIQKTITNLLLGFEIVEHTKDGCILKNMAEEKVSEFDFNQRRYMLQVKEVIENLAIAIKNKDLDSIDHILIRDQTIDKLGLFMRRILNTRGHKDDLKGKSLYYTICLLETVSDRCRDMCKRIKEKNEFPSNKLADLLKLIHESLDIYISVFYKWNPEKLVILKKKNEEIKKKLFSSPQADKSDLFFFCNVYAIVQLSHDLSEEIGLVN